MKKRILLTVCLSALIVSMSISCKGKSVEATNDGDELSGNISISGAFALYPLAVK